MQARCPHCGTVYAIDRKLLRRASGLARCYNCGSVFNALQSTLDVRGEPPPPPLPSAAAASLSASPGGPDLPFEIPDNLPELKPSARVDLASRDTLHPAARTRIPWWQKMLLFLLVMALTAQVAWLQRDHWIHLPQVTQVCTWLNCPPPPQRPDLFSVVDREMQALPGPVPLLRLQLRFRNNASYPLPLARLQLSLLDANGSLVGRRSLSPEEYLPSSWSGPFKALPGEVITIELDLQDPGPRVRSYVFDFV